MDRIFKQWIELIKSFVYNWNVMLCMGTTGNEYAEMQHSQDVVVSIHGRLAALSLQELCLFICEKTRVYLQTCLNERHMKGRTIMIKNRTAQLIFETIYVTLGFIGSVACLGIFDNVNAIHWEFYVHFTNHSNFLCIGVMLAGLIQTAKKKEDGFVSVAPMLKFISTIGILLTFFVFNFVLAGAADRDPQANWKVGSLIFHVVLPIMYTADWLLFYERKKSRWYYPVASLAFPLVYIIFLLIQAVILKFDSSILIPGTTNPLIYPYFFLNLDRQGVGVVLAWIGFLAAAFVMAGFLLFGFDKLGKKKN